MEKKFEINGLLFRIEVRLNASSTTKTVQNRIWHEEKVITVPLHAVYLYRGESTEPYASRSCEPSKLEDSIRELEGIANSLIPPKEVDTPEKKFLRKLGFS